MNVGFARPNVSELIFHLYGRSIHPELFKIYNEVSIEQDGFRAVVRICDAGHMVEFHRNDHIVTEVATSDRQPLPRKKRFLEKRLRGNRDESFRFELGLRYQASYQLERLDP